MPLVLRKIIHDGEYPSLSVQQVPLLRRDCMCPTSGTVVMSISIRKILHTCCRSSHRRRKNDELTARKRGARSTLREKKDQVRGHSLSEKDFAHEKDPPMSPGESLRWQARLVTVCSIVVVFQASTIEL